MAVKRVLRHPRPAATCALIGKCHKYGMPSSHAQVMAYAFTTALLMHLHRRRNRKNSKRKTEIFEIFELLFLAALSILVAIARVYLGYHGVDQVMAGLVLGSVFAGVWFWVIKMAHKTGTATSIENLFSSLLQLRNAFEEGYVVHQTSLNKTKKLR
jgi:membrane-associated phospholipid phosphatase